MRVQQEAEFYSQQHRDFEVKDVCPVCGFDCVHLTRVVVNQGGRITICAGESSRVIEGKPTGRGTSVWVHFYGECGHAWVIRWQFHKGVTYWERLREPDAEGSWPEGMWRD